MSSNKAHSICAVRDCGKCTLIYTPEEVSSKLLPPGPHLWLDK